MSRYNPSWEEMEEVLVSVVVDGWEMYVKESRPKGQRLPNEVDPEKVAISHDGVPQSGASSSNEAAQQMVDAATTELPGEPEHFQPHEVEEPEVDAEIIDAMLKPYADKLPMVSDERDIDEDLDEDIVFREPIVGGPASLLARRKAKPSANKIHAVEFKLDGSGVVNVLTSDVTRDPAKLELKLETTTEGTSGPIIVRHYDLNDEEMQKCNIHGIWVAIHGIWVAEFTAYWLLAQHLAGTGVWFMLVAGTILGTGAWFMLVAGTVLGRNRGLVHVGGRHNTWNRGLVHVGGRHSTWQEQGFGSSWWQAQYLEQGLGSCWWQAHSIGRALLLARNKTWLKLVAGTATWQEQKLVGGRQSTWQEQGLGSCWWQALPLGRNRTWFMLVAGTVLGKNRGLVHVGGSHYYLART